MLSFSRSLTGCEANEAWDNCQGKIPEPSGTPHLAWARSQRFSSQLVRSGRQLSKKCKSCLARAGKQDYNSKSIAWHSTDKSVEAIQIGRTVQT